MWPTLKKVVVVSPYVICESVGTFVSSPLDHAVLTWSLVYYLVSMRIGSVFMTSYYPESTET